MVADEAFDHIITRVTDEGLVVEVFDLPGAPLFVGETAEPTLLLETLARLIQDAAKVVTNKLAIEGHVASQPIVVVNSVVWEHSSSRANAMRILMNDIGTPDGRISRVTGHADRENAARDPMDVRNNRLELIFLREGKT